jgi:putative SOS response-associated peptidase YedK
LFPGSSEKHALKAPLVVAEVHDRMPVVLESKDFASWLNDGGPSLLKPAANDVLQR